jgi:hypothetical protein
LLLLFRRDHQFHCQAVVVKKSPFALLRLGHLFLTAAMSDEDRRRSPDREDDGYGDKQSAGSNGRRTPPNDNDRDDRGGGGRGGAAEAAADDRRGKGDAVIGSASLRPVFLGNLDANFRSDDVIAIFERPVEPPNASMRFAPIAVDRIDVKRGYCFVFLKDVSTQAEKEQAERFVQEINGMYVIQFFAYSLRRFCLPRFLFLSPFPP